MSKFIYRTCESADYLAPQEFSDFEPEYQLNELGDELVVVGEKNIKEFIQSNAECALDRLLDKFGFNDKMLDNYNVIDSGQVVEVSHEDDLLLIGETIEDFQYVTNKLGLPVTASLDEVLKAYNLLINNNKVKESDNNEKKIEEEN